MSLREPRQHGRVAVADGMAGTGKDVAVDPDALESGQPPVGHVAATHSPRPDDESDPDEEKGSASSIGKNGEEEDGECEDGDEACDDAAPKQSIAAWVASNLHYSMFFLAMITFIAGGLVTVLVDPTERDFSPADETISHENNGSTVHIIFVFATCFVSAVLIYIGEITDSAVDHTRAMRIRHGLQLGLDALSASFLTLAITMLVKVSVGQPRPDLATTCPDLQDCNPDSWQAFPSGHTSFAFAISSYTGFYLFWALYIRGMPPLAEWHWHAIPTLVTYEAHDRAGAATAVTQKMPASAEQGDEGPRLREKATVRVEDGDDDNHLQPRVSNASAAGRRSNVSAANGDSVVIGSHMRMPKAERAARRRLKLPTLKSVMREEFGQVGRLFAILIPQAMSIGVAISRVIDNRHSLIDVVGGAFIGVLVSFFVFLRTVLLMERSPRSPVPDRPRGGTLQQLAELAKRQQQEKEASDLYEPAERSVSDDADARKRAANPDDLERARREAAAGASAGRGMAPGAGVADGPKDIRIELGSAAEPHSNGGTRAAAAH